MPKPRERRRADVIAVIDIGSNSGRVMVFTRDPSNQLRVLASSRTPLRLVPDVDADGALSEATIARTMEALRDYHAIATRAGATRIVAVATAAMRDAANGPQFVERVRHELGIQIEIIGGLAEARYGFHGALRGLTVPSGLLFDLGGGSIQITEFAQRRLARQVSLPLGALRVSERYLTSDPPTNGEIRRLRDDVRKQLSSAGVTRLPAGSRLIGTGGTLRNLAKIDRQTMRYPIGWLHGYELSAKRLGHIVDRLASTKEKHRDDIEGLSAARADSIAGGAVVIHALAEFVNARDILVSGHGVREGVALRLLKMPPAPPETVRETCLSSFASRFSGWSRDAALRRQTIARSLQRALAPDASPTMVTAIDNASRLLDIGRTFDIENRHQHVSEMLLSTELTGFTHHEIALTSAIVQRAGDRHADIPELALADSLDEIAVDRAAVLLAVADEIDARCPLGRAVPIECRVGRHVTVAVPALQSWLVKDLDKRFERAFGRSLVMKHSTGPLVPIN